MRRVSNRKASWKTARRMVEDVDEALGPVCGCDAAHLLDDLHSQGVDRLARVGPCARDTESVPGAGTENGLGHLTPGRVARAEEKDAERGGGLGHASPP
jgi:hypothetical protein